MKIGTQELLIVLVIAVLIFGPTQIPKLNVLIFLQAGLDKRPDMVEDHGECDAHPSHKIPRSSDEKKENKRKQPKRADHDPDRS